MLEVLTARCLTTLRVSAAAVLLADPDGRLRLAVASCHHSRTVEMFAVATDTGPAVDAVRTGAQVYCPHIDRDARAWPGFAAAARLGGFRAAHALPLRHHGRTIGAVSLLDTRARSLDPDQRALAQALADDAGTVWSYDHPLPGSDPTAGQA